MQTEGRAIYLRALDVVMQVVPQGVDEVDGVVPSILRCVSWKEY